MQNIEQLNESTRAMLPKKTEGDLAPTVDGLIIHLTHVFKGGFTLGFWSHSPWGTCHNQEEGWVVLSNEFKMIESCETKTGGLSANNDFREWRRGITSTYGKSKKLCPAWENSLFWKIQEA